MQIRGIWKNVIKVMPQKNIASNTWFKREEKKKMTIRLGRHETENHFVLLVKETQHFL